jgi:hypothetical protein
MLKLSRTPRFQIKQYFHKAAVMVDHDERRLQRVSFWMTTDLLN